MKKHIPSTQTIKHIAVLAGAGTGKTTSIINDIVKVISQDHVQAKNILALTFSRRSASDLRHRLKDEAGSIATDVTIKTFHALAADIVSSNIKDIELTANPSILHEYDAKEVLRGILAKDASYRGVVTTKSAWDAIERYKCNGILPEMVEDIDNTSKLIARAYKKFQQELFASNTLTFSDLILYAIKIFRENPEILQKYVSNYQLIYVDEFQDTSLAQYELLNLLAGKTNRLFVVGDDDQCIYSWRYVSPRMMEKFKKDYKIPAFTPLTKNHRSTASIVYAANKLISNNENRIEKQLIPTKPDGKLVKVKRLVKQEEEAKWIADKINKLLINADDKSKTVAILCRHREYFRKIETQLMRAKIDYQIADKATLTESSKLLLAYLQAVANCSNGIAFKKIINTPKRGIGTNTINEIARKAKLSKTSFWETAKKLNNAGKLKKATAFIEQFTKWQKYAENHSVKQVAERIIKDVALYEFVKFKKIKNSGLNELMSLMSPQQSVQDFLDEMLDEQTDNKKMGKNKVGLMTIHAAKGLEFDYVFLPAWEEHRFPDTRSDEEEERRLAFVAVTRAKVRLFISSVLTKRDGLKNKSSDVRASRFTKELDEDYVEKRRSKQASKWLENHKRYVEPSYEIDVDNIVSYNAYGKSENYGYGKVTGILGKQIEVEFNGYDVGTVEKSDVTKVLLPSKKDKGLSLVQRKMK